MYLSLFQHLYSLLKKNCIFHSVSCRLYRVCLSECKTLSQILLMKEFVSLPLLVPLGYSAKQPQTDHWPQNALSCDRHFCATGLECGKCSFVLNFTLRTGYWLNYISILLEQTNMLSMRTNQSTPSFDHTQCAGLQQHDGIS